MRIDLSAIPILTNSSPVPGAGTDRTVTQWGEVIAALRPRFMVLSYKELCRLLRNMEMPSKGSSANSR